MRLVDGLETNILRVSPVKSDYMRSTKWVTGLVPGNLMFKIVKQLPHIKFNHVLSL